MIDKSKRIGTTVKMNCGMKATVIEYRNHKDIDIQFEDGTVIKKRQWDEFQNGSIQNPNFMNALNKGNSLVLGKTKSRIGTSKVMNCGLKATITNYRNANDIDVTFDTPTGQVLIPHKKYQHFQSGSIKCQVES